ncbi:uncharacterized protein LOC134254662 isoform X2 [Saccostrea cucullata]|uniref:uncharacterized protein LOC134254662 isoform X2 n=1 Tax=Saccostrea cuccullata TaxID=36930 RepID=UPI002ED67ED9
MTTEFKGQELYRMAEDGMKDQTFSRILVHCIIISTGPIRTESWFGEHRSREVCEILGEKNILSNYMKEFLAEEENVEPLARENIMVMFLTVILLLSNFLSMVISSRSKKRYFLLWTDKALLLVLWTCGDVEQNPGPNKTTPGKRRSEILREFRRSVQTILLELIYKAYGEEMPSKPYSKNPPGWDEYQPEIKFGNISNLKSREDKIFNKMIYLLKNQKPVPLSSEWEALLSHYTNLHEKLEVAESKKALNCWMLEKNLAPLLKSYSEDVDDPSGEVLIMCVNILKKAHGGVLETKETDGKDWKKQESKTNGPEQLIAEARRENISSKLFKLQTYVLETKGDDEKDWKTHESEPNGSGLLISEAREKNLSWNLLKSKEECKSDFEESAGSSSSSDHFTEIQRVEVPDHSQRKRKRMETISTNDRYEERMDHIIDYKRTYPVKNYTAIVTKETSKENNPLFTYNYGLDTLKTTGEQNIRMNEENVDLNMARSNSPFNESSRDQSSKTGDKFGVLAFTV